MSVDKRGMLETMRLLKSGDLKAATAKLQHELGISVAKSAAVARTNSQAPASVVIDGEFEILSEAPQSTDALSAQRFECAAGGLDYHLNIPSGQVSGLLLMLHGCTQSPLDFARGTRMNALAAQQGLAVLWPAQTVKQNNQKCWNWFRSRDQQHEHGEAALLRNLVLHVRKTHQWLDRPLFGAGLSAGAAMITVLAGLNPSLFSAIGVHSGLPAGVAHDLPSALAAMKQAPSRPTPFKTTVPCIVFHGDADATVHPSHADAIVTQCLGPAQVDRLSRVVERGATNGRDHSCVLIRTPSGKVISERWLIHGAGHGWSGGDASGSWTDALGPDASAQMLRFFAHHS